MAVTRTLLGTSPVLADNREQGKGEVTPAFSETDRSMPSDSYVLNMEYVGVHVGLPIPITICDMLLGFTLCNLMNICQG